MRHLQTIPSFLFTLLLISSAAAQTADSQIASGSLEEDAIAAARIPYPKDETPSVNAADKVLTAQTGDDSKDDRDTLAQMRRRPSRPLSPRPRYPHRSYPNPWVEPGSGRHAAIGAVIGFGLGAAVGARANTDQHPGAGVRASLLVGTFGALIGAAVGYGVPPMQRWAANRHRHRWPQPDPRPNEDELASVSNKAPAPEQSATLQPASKELPVQASLVAP
jgi:hypothetical protein